MTLTDLVPSLDLCRQLKDAGFPQDTALVWVKLFQEPWLALEVEQVLERKEVHTDYILCAAPTAGELEEWLRVNNPCRYVSTYYEQYETPERRWRVESDLAKKPEPNLSTCRAETLVAALAQLCLEVAG